MMDIPLNFQDDPSGSGIMRDTDKKGVCIEGHQTFRYQIVNKHCL